MLINNLINVSLSAPASLGLTYLAMSESISILMENAVSAERDSQIVQNAAVTQCCALMISAGAAFAAHSG
ncbi:RebB family R body protein [Sessilibacter sp. MAH4]